MDIKPVIADRFVTKSSKTGQNATRQTNGKFVGRRPWFKAERKPRG